MAEKKQGKQGQIMGPVDYLLVMFPGNRFTGKIAPELVDLEKKGIIRVIDLVMVMKDARGRLGIIEANALQGEAGAAYRELAQHTREWFTEADIEAFATTLPVNSSAGLLLFEHVWAKKFKQALLDADAQLIDMGRIPPDIIQKAEKQLMAKGGV